MQAIDVLSFGMGDIGSLNRPVMLVGLEGWFDVASAATQAVNAFTSADHAVIVGTIDPDPFYDFTQQRPHACGELLGGDEDVLRPIEDGSALRSECDTAAGALEHTQPHIAFGCAHACADCLLTESELAAGGTHAAQARNRDHHIERSEVGHPG